MKVIGITGPTGAGKTTALGALEDLGGTLIDCDELYHTLLEESEELRAALVARFGDILDGQGRPDRKKLGAIVFDKANDLSDLNAITHRFILQALQVQLRAAAARGSPAVGVDAIALIESGVAASCDAVVGILAPKPLRIRRIMDREGISEDYARLRVEAQQEDAFYRAHCTHILENDEGETQESFREKARALFQNIILI
ncbi:MAG: dephospho-CoA kinase [Pseudoflavonifractor sp.]